MIRSQLMIRQQPSKITLKITDHQFQIKKTDVSLSLKTIPGKLEIKNRNAVIKVDSYPSHYDLGLKKHHDLTKDIFRKTASRVLETIRQFAREGDRLMEFEKGRAIAELAKQKTPLRKRRELTLKDIRSPEIEVIPSEQKLKYRPGRVKVDTSSFRPLQIELDWGKVEVELSQQAWLEVTSKNQERLFPGKHINQVV